jgi:hypothetical protein
LKHVLILLFGLLVAIVAAELSNGTGHYNGAGKDTGAMRVMPEAEKSVRPEAGSVDQWVSVALARPLFAPTRKPTASGEAGLPRLTAIIIASPSDGVAIFQGSRSAKPLPVRRGETVAGWQVMTIGGDTVGLQKGGAQLVIRPEFDNLKSTAPAVTKPRPRWEAAAETGVLRARWSNPQLQP